MAFRPISNELQKKAEDELNEVPSRIQEDLHHLREWIQKQPHLNVRLDDQWLLAFVRGCKFSLEKTKQKLESFYTLRTLVPEFFSNRDPLTPEIQEILSLGCYWVPLPKSKDPAAPRVLYKGNGLFDPEKIRLVDVMKVNFMIFDILMNEDDNFVIAGHHSFIDLKGFVVGHMLQITPSFIRKTGTCFLEGYPGRPKGMHFINMATVFETMLRPFLVGQRIGNRITINSGTHYGHLHNLIHKSLLPKDFEGENGTLSDLIAEWKTKIESYREWFLEDSKYFSDESKRLGKPKFSSDMFGTEGSFRKLDID